MERLKEENAAAAAAAAAAATVASPPASFAGSTAASPPLLAQVQQQVRPRCGVEEVKDAYPLVPFHSTPLLYRSFAAGRALFRFGLTVKVFRGWAFSGTSC